MVRLDHHQELLDQLLVRNHNGPAYIATIYAICTWIDAGPEPDWGEYIFGNVPALHAAPYYHPVGNPPTQMPPAPENLVASVLEWENTVPTPPLRPVRSRRPTPYPASPAPLALPWYGVGGVPALQTGEGSGLSMEEKLAGEESAKVVAEEVVVVEGDGAGGGVDVGAAVVELAELNLEVPPALAAEERAGASRAQKRRTRRKKAKESARALRRSLRLI